MASREGQFRRTMARRFGTSGAARAERGVKKLKGDPGVDNPFAIVTAAMNKSRKMGR